MENTDENKYKVRLVPVTAFTQGAVDVVQSSIVAFDVTPTFSEQRTADYEALTPVHMPGSVQVYRKTNSRTFSITARLISRNVADALKNMSDLQLLRSWLLPYFGTSDTLSENHKEMRRSRAATGSQDDATPLTETQRDALVRDSIVKYGVQLKGAPPDVLYLYAYSNDAIDNRGGATYYSTTVNINRVPVVLASLDISYPEDVDYIPVSSVDPIRPDATFTQPFPRRLDVTLSLLETHSPYEYEKFNLKDFKLGNLARF